MPVPENTLSTSSDHLARAIKLSHCYLTFYIVQMLMAVSLCGFLFFDHMEFVPFVEIPIAFFIVLDMILNHFMDSRKQFCTKIQMANMFVLLGSVTIILLDLVIPHITKNKIYTLFEIIRNLRYLIQFVWIIKLGFESRKLLKNNIQNHIVFDVLKFDGEEEMTKMAL